MHPVWAAFSSTIEEPLNDDRHEALVCGRHTDEELGDGKHFLLEMWTPRY
jgi:hypothetical protein